MIQDNSAFENSPKMRASLFTVLPITLAATYSQAQSLPEAMQTTLDSPQAITTNGRLCCE
ncbi:MULTISPECIES: hypothetical protein [Pseudomonas]|uniref:hypothetical protein n=1 Tax=Pseudomonas TaxID=286 RepID=UPI0016453DC7|nr:hypothetical protein [Pseudomonas sp. SWRI77]MBC3483953.1 hypothetical protein [Pseudomonas sp. SWRI77]